MDFLTVKQHVAGVPYILPEMAEDLYSFIRSERPQNCLELGFGHGASSCYMAAALAANGSGRLTAVDLESAREWQKPAIEELLGVTGLENIVRVRREPTSYTWFLKKEIEAASSGGVCTPGYDFCFLDGAKNWTIDSAAFFLIDKLLKPGGWIVFDDLQWTYRSKLAEGKRKTDGVYMAGMSDDELDQPHVELIYSLLVMQHPDYANFIIKDDWWAWAQKTTGRRDVRFDYSAAYLLRRAEQERKTGVKKRLPLSPWQ